MCNKVFNADLWYMMAILNRYLFINAACVAKMKISHECLHLTFLDYFSCQTLFQIWSR